MTADPDPIDVPVSLGPRSYTVRVVADVPDGFGPFVHATLDTTWGGRSSRRVLVVTDANVEPLLPPYLAGLEGVGLAVEVAVLPPGEGTKILASAATLYDRLVAMRADRHTVVVAIGGGVVGDLAGFVAATYARGLPLVMVPTTLLAQVDSSVGGKVGVNHPGAKNIVGAFHQPVAVWIDTATLRTLPPRELRCGLAEVVKYGVILDAGFFDHIEAEVPAILSGEPAILRHLVARSCALKADVVSKDEREETGLRAVLNFGHTVGHAIEAVAGYGGAYQHGEAVAAGMVIESRIAERIGWVGPEVTDRLATLLRRFGLPTSAEGLDTDDLSEAMARDKKNRDGQVRFVLPRSIGRVELTDAARDGDVRAALMCGPGGFTVGR